MLGYSFPQSRAGARCDGRERVDTEGDKDMACQVLFEFRIKDGCENKLKQHLKEILPDTRNYPGCLNLHMVQDMEDPAKVVLN